MTTTVAVTVTSPIVAMTRRYYVDATTGSDDDTGLTPDLAWETVAKVNAATFWPGDWIVFKRGETWSGTRLTTPSSGVAGLLITFSEYGSGALPVITAPAATESIRTNAQDYLVIDSIYAKYGTSYVINIAQSHDIEVTNCTVEGDVTQRANGIFIQGTDATTYNVRIAGCTAFNNKAIASGGGGINCYSSSGWLDNLTVENCTVYSNGTDTNSDHGIYFHYATNSIIRNNTSYSNTAGGIKINTCHDCLVYNNVCYSNGKGIIFSAEAGLSAGDNTIYNNILYSNNPGILILVPAMSNNSLFYHNTLVNNTTTCLSFYYAGTTGLTFKNNIFFNDYLVTGDGTEVVRIYDDADVSDNTFDYNLGYYANHSGEATIMYRRTNTLVKYTFAQWQGLGADANGVSDNPDFVTEYTNLHLQSTSPCRSAGADLDVATDYDGVARDDTPDIGAYEYVA